MRTAAKLGTCTLLIALASAAVGCNAAQDGATVEAADDGPNPTPVALAEAIAAIDLRQFPVMEQAERVERSPAVVSFSVPGGGVDGAVAFMREKLGALGWTPAADAKLSVINEHGAQLFFVKGGQRLYSALGVSPADKNLNVTLFHLGNTDARKLPYFAGVEFVDSLPARTICTTTAKPEEVQKALREPFAKAGWREYKEPTSRGMEGYVRTDRSLKFFQNGTMVDVLIMPVDGKTNVYTTVKLLKAEWPIDPSATVIEFQEDPLFVFYPTKLGLKEAVEYCRTHLTAAGWKERAADGETKADAVTVVFDAAGREPTKLEVVVNRDITFVMLAPWTGKEKK